MSKPVLSHLRVESPMPEEAVERAHDHRASEEPEPVLLPLTMQEASDLLGILEQTPMTLYGYAVEADHLEAKLRAHLPPVETPKPPE